MSARIKVMSATALAVLMTVNSACQQSSILPDLEISQGVLIFEDHFERNESQELKDEVGNEWFTNEGLANGRKQFDLKDGIVNVKRHKEARHGPGMAWRMNYKDANDHQRNSVKDARVKLRFKVTNGNFSLSWGDRSAKGIRHNNIAGVLINSRKVEFDDMKTGGSNLVNYAAIISDAVTPEMRVLLDSTIEEVPYKLNFNEWYDLELTTIGEMLSVKINNEPIGSIISPGIAHENKQLIRVLGSAVYAVDDIYVYTFDPPLAQ